MIEQNPNINVILHKMVEHMSARNYAHSTIKTYSYFIRNFHQWNKNNLEITEDIVLKYMSHLYNIGRSTSTVNQGVNAIKYWTEQVCGQPRRLYNLNRPKKERPLPRVLNSLEMKAILGAIKNGKHRLIVKVIYACGLRVGELCSLELSDIDGERQFLHIRCSKQYKDRMVPLPESLLTEMRDYYKKDKPFRYLFEGAGSTPQNPTKYSQSSIRQVLRRAVKSAGINRKVRTHDLRHSYATSMLEAGVDIRYIQELLGHASTKTTEIYTHVSVKKLKNLPNPLDDL